MPNEALELFRAASLQQILNCVPRLTSSDPLSDELTVVFRFGPAVKIIIQKLQNEFYAVAPDLFYYPAEQLHMTFLGKIPVNFDQKLLKETIQVLNKKYTFCFRLWGTGMGSFSTSLSAYPVDFSLKDAREEFRSLLKISGSDFSIHLPEYEYVGWINFIRNTTAVPNEQFREKVMAFQNEDFGTYRPEKIDILRNHSWVLDPNESTVLESLPL